MGPSGSQNTGQVAKKLKASVNNVDHDARRKLPVWQHRKNILSAVAEKQVTVLIGETGSGKTTQTPQFLADAGYIQKGVIGVTQPRRVAAVSVCKRVADECGVPVGEKVGYQVRFQEASGPNTKIRFMTDGILVREAVLTPDFSRYSVIILDEAHERSIHTDILLGLCKQVLAKRKDIKIVVMSATIAHKQFVDFFGGEQVCSVVKVPGRSHPVDLFYTPAPEPDFLEAALIAIMQIHQEREKGDILVFLPGQEDIEGLVSILQDKRKLLAQHKRKDGSALDDLLIAPIFAALPFEQQIAVFNPAPANTRKVVLGTNIAETSITINGIRYVIDAGFVKLKVCHPATGVEILKLSGTSRASADQRSGRAGREAPGEAYRLYEEAEYGKMLAQTPPEIVRVEMASVYLQLKSLGIDVDTFPFMDSPNPQHLKKSALLLLRLGALNREKGLTELGRKLAVLPLHPLYGRALLVAQEFECVSEMLSIVAMLSSDSIFYQSKSQKPEMVAARSALQHNDGDHLTLLRIYNQWSKLPEGKRRNFCMEVGLNMHSMKRAHDIRKQLKDLLPQVGIKHITSVGGIENWSRVRQCLLKGCFVNIAKLDEVGGTMYLTMNSRQQAKIHPHSGLFTRRPLPACIMYSELVTTSQNYLRTVTEIEPAWLLTHVPHYFAKDTN